MYTVDFAFQAFIQECNGEELRCQDETIDPKYGGFDLGLRGGGLVQDTLDLTKDQSPPPSFDTTVFQAG